MKSNGKVESYETKPKKDGGAWYRVKISNRYYSTFEDPKDYIGKLVEVTYTEQPNPQNAEHPYKNIVPSGIRVLEDKPENTASDVKSDVVNSVPIKSPQFLGMCMNQAVQVMIHKEKKFTSEEYKEMVKKFHTVNLELQKELGY